MGIGLRALWQCLHSHNQDYKTHHVHDRGWKIEGCASGLVTGRLS